ncbi:ABC transporter substrate-binding protein [Gordonia sp. DT30]|uniref:ABC transporter substrate-binding protein n=1 Tax=unclassified Gordonia (in: high G+C Gram-positive bacteria) TaxID=2657482 RepID=UPI003CF5DCB5
MSAVAAALTISATLVAAGCSSNSDSSSSSGAPGDLSSVSLKIGQTGWRQTYAALQVAGLDHTPYKTEWPVFSGGDQQMQAIQSEAIDVAQSSEIPPIFAAAGGTVRFKQVAFQTSTTLLQEVIVGKDSSITSIKQLKGKKVGYVKNTTAAYFLNELLKQNGLTWKDIEPKPLLPNEGLAALNGGSIDAFASYGNTIIQAHQGGAKTIGSGENILSGNFPWVAANGVLSDAGKKAAVADLLGRINRAWIYVRNGHEQEYAQAFADATHQPLNSALTQVQNQERQRPTTVHTPTPEAVQSQQRVADSLQEIGALPGHVVVKDLWTNDLDTLLTQQLSATPSAPAAAPATSSAAG